MGGPGRDDPCHRPRSRRRLRRGVRCPAVARHPGPSAPGVQRRDLRLGRRRAADRGDRAGPGLALRCGQGARPPDGPGLPLPWALRRDLHPLQPRVTAASRGLCDPQDHGRCRADRRRGRREPAAREPRCGPRLGLGRGLRRRHGPGLSAYRGGGLRGRLGYDAYSRGVRAGRVRAGRDRRLGDHVEIDPAFVRPVDANVQRGDASKAVRELDWRPTVAFDEVVGRMVDHDLELLRASAGS